jgi:hypothetical protein
LGVELTRLQDEKKEAKEDKNKALKILIERSEERV